MAAPDLKRMWQLEKDDLIFRLGYLMKVVSVDEKEIVLQNLGKHKGGFITEIGSLSKELVEYRGKYVRPIKESRAKSVVKTNRELPKYIYPVAARNAFYVRVIHNGRKVYGGCYSELSKAVLAKEKLLNNLKKIKTWNSF